MLDTTRLDTMLAEDRLIRGDWTGTDAQGRETACLLAALSPDVARSHDPSACPATIMPAWLAHLTPWMDDWPSDEAWSNIVQRYAALARRWHVLDADAWDRAHYAVRALIVREAARHTRRSRQIAACEMVATLCERRSRGDRPGDSEWSAAAATAATAAAASAAAVREATAAAAARAAAVDRLCIGILDAIEEQISNSK